MIKSNRPTPIKMPPITDSEPYSYRALTISTLEIIEEVERFLNKYFKGAYEGTVMSVSHRHLKICPEGFAYVLKLIFKAVYGKELIKISCSLSYKTLDYIVKFNTELLTDEDIQKITKAALDSQVALKINRDSIDFCISVFIEKYYQMSSISPSIVYRSLVDMFFVDFKAGGL